jgi:hypothetical protein
VPEWIIAHLSQKCGRLTQLGDGDGDVGGCAPGRFDEPRRLANSDSAFQGDKIDQEFAQSDETHHASFPVRTIWGKIVDGSNHGGKP